LRRVNTARAVAAVAANGGFIISASNLTKRYGELIAVDEVSFEVRRGEIFGILGPNGAGKTTTLEMVEGLRPPDGGHIVIDGLSVWPDPAPVKARIGVQLQATALFDYLRLHEIIHLFGSCYGMRRTPAEIDALLDRVGLLEKRRSYAAQLSGGQAQRLSIALALVNEPVVTFLDEPTTGLDPRARRLLWDVIRAISEAGTTIVLTTHYMEEAERLCARVAVMDHGHVMALDTPRALVHSLGADAHITFTLSESLPTRDLGGLDGVSSCALVEEGSYSVVASGVQRAVVSLLGLAAQRGVTVENLDVQGANLEDVFLHMTGRKLAEEEEEDERPDEPPKPRRRAFTFGGGR
jgi:ABC-2 type transport system ATP-binding protein